jgi:glycerophosphoryl diester phosphodiesterase
MRPYQPKPSAGSSPYVIAHRGISGKAPENTMAAFEAAVATPGIDMIELDVRLTRDGEVVALHDRTLQRTSTGNGSARSYTAAELKQFDAGSWFSPEFSAQRIPTLREVIDLVRDRCWLNIEIKSDFFHREPEGLLERSVVETVKEAAYEEHVLYSSFNHRLIANVKRMYPHTATGVIYNIWHDFGRLPSKLAGRANASVFVCGRYELTPAMLRDARAHGLAVYVYTLNSRTDVRKTVELGVDGILSDVADEIVPFVKQGRVDSAG